MYLCCLGNYILHSLKYGWSQLYMYVPHFVIYIYKVVFVWRFTQNIIYLQNFLMIWYESFRRDLLCVNIFFFFFFFFLVFFFFFFFFFPIRGFEIEDIFQFSHNEPPDMKKKKKQSTANDLRTCLILHDNTWMHSGLWLTTESTHASFYFVQWFIGWVGSLVLLSFRRTSNLLSAFFSFLTIWLFSEK